MVKSYLWGPSSRRQCLHDRPTQSYLHPALCWAQIGGDPIFCLTVAACLAPDSPLDQQIHPQMLFLLVKLSTPSLMTLIVGFGVQERHGCRGVSMLQRLR